MPLVNAKCTNCGAPLQVDNTHEAAVCQYCGSAFIVEKAIQNYNYYVTQNIQANNVNVTAKGNAEKERLLHNAETNMGFKDYDKAYEIYKQVSEDYPDEYRGWYGMTQIITNNFTKYALEHSTYRETTKFMDKALMCVTPDQKTNIKKAWDTFLAKRTDYLSQLKSQIAKNENELAELHSQLSEENKMLVLIKTKAITLSDSSIIKICFIAILLIAAVIFMSNPDNSVNAAISVFGSAIGIPLSIIIFVAIKNSKNRKVNTEVQEYEQKIARLKNQIVSCERATKKIKDTYNIKQTNF